jgi:hypothetical protein
MQKGATRGVLFGFGFPVRRTGFAPATIAISSLNDLNRPAMRLLLNQIQYELIGRSQSV